MNRWTAGSLERFDNPKEIIMNPSNPSTRVRGLVATAIFVVLALGLSIVSAADPSSASRTVRFADLNMSTPSGAHVLYTRILAAAQVVCSYYSFATDADKARCVLEATADAVTKINQPAMSAVYNAKNRTPVPTSLVSQSR
jgi:UrcA family protein